MKNNFFFYLGKISVQVIWDLVYFPLWWYSTGFIRLLKFLANFLRERWIVIGAGVWLKNLFRPMYGQSDFASRLISFFIRLFQIIFRFIVFLFFVALSMVIILLWLGLPIILLRLIYFKIFD
ncbi:MAG: hypothetical protein ACOXZ1_03260 [Patescibacteria group bacterium]|jgi:hypothetical protein|nr:hypothetical protein [Patescibacteria group bacterium]